MNLQKFYTGLHDPKIRKKRQQARRCKGIYVHPLELETDTKNDDHGHLRENSQCHPPHPPRNSRPYKGTINHWFPLRRPTISWGGLATLAVYSMSWKVPLPRQRWFAVWYP